MNGRLWTPDLIRPPLPVVEGALRNLRRRDQERWKHISDPRVDLYKRQCAISYASLTSGSNTANQSTAYSTASVTPSANKLILLIVLCTATALRTMTVSGCSLTWVEEETITFNTAGTPLWRLSVFRAMGASPTTGTVDILPSASSTGMLWSLVELDGVDTTGTNGSGAIVQSVPDRTDGVTTFAVTLAAFGSADNATFGAFGTSRNEVHTQGAGFTQAHDVGMTAPAARVQTQYLLGNSTTVDCSWTNAAAVGGIGIEIKAAAAGAAFLASQNKPIDQAVNRASFF